MHLVDGCASGDGLGPVETSGLLLWEDLNSYYPESSLLFEVVDSIRTLQRQVNEMQ